MPTRGLRWQMALLLAGAFAFSGGCAGSSKKNPFTGSLGEVFEPFYASTPGQLARDAFDYSDPDKRRNAIAKLSSASFGGVDEYLRLYRLAAQSDPDDSVRATALNALGRHGKIEDADLIAKLLTHNADAVRREAAIALQRIHSPDAAAALISAATGDSNAEVRMNAVKALGQYPRPAVYDVLVGALHDRNFGVAHHAQRSLRILTGQDHGLDATKWMRWSEQNSNRLFAQRKAYQWKPYERPRRLIDRMQFWKEQPRVDPKAPTGLEVRG